MTKRTKYGESTILVSLRVPESKKEEILNRFYSVLNDYMIENPFVWKDGKVDSDVVLKSDVKIAEKKSNPADIDIIKSDEIYKAKESTPIQKVNIKKYVDMDVLRAIANGQGVKSELFVSKKKPIEDEYDFEYVTSLPDADSQVPIGSKGIAFYDRYDLGRFYVRYEGKYLRFEGGKEFNRFAKDNNIK